MVNKPIYICDKCGWQAPNGRTQAHGPNVNNACSGRILRIDRFQWAIAAGDAIRRNVLGGSR